MDYNYMITNIVRVISYICVKDYFLIDIYRYNNDIRIDIVNKSTEQLIYQKDFKDLKNEYHYLINDLIEIFCTNDITISKLFKSNNNICQQNICSNNLEFAFQVNSNNFIEVKKTVKRHYEFNMTAQRSKILKKQKTNQSTLIAAG